MTTARQHEPDTQCGAAGDAPQPSDAAQPKVVSVGGETSTSHPEDETHSMVAGGPPPIGEPTPRASSAGEDFGTPLPIGESPPIDDTAGADFLDLRIWAESFNDAQQHRIATINRMERGGVDADALEGHRTLLEDSEHAFKLAMVRSYRRVVRQHMPAVEEWQKTSFGIGEHLLARLLGHLGHPVIATPYQWMDEVLDGHECIPEKCGKRHLVALEPFVRTVGQLWQYCGHGRPVKRKKGMSQDEAFGLGNPSCKFLVHLLAEATIKCQPQPIPGTEPARGSVGATDSPPSENSASIQRSAGSPQPRTVAIPAIPPVGDKYRYRRVYDLRKAETEGRRLAGCTTCKGDVCSDGHRHADALRIVGKEILRDLWTHARQHSDIHAGIGVGGRA